MVKPSIRHFRVVKNFVRMELFLLRILSSTPNISKERRKVMMAIEEAAKKLLGIYEDARCGYPCGQEPLGCVSCDSSWGTIIPMEETFSCNDVDGCYACPYESRCEQKI
jgi:hypothetical protein